MTVLYNQHTITSIFVGQTGHQHTKAPGAPEMAPMAIDCAQCQPFLLREGWVVSPESVPLTDRQIREKERIEREGSLAVRQASEAMASFANAKLTGGSSRPRAKRGAAGSRNR